MAWVKSRVKHLGSLRGVGQLCGAEDSLNYGPVHYEIDGFVERGTRRGTGWVEGCPDVLTRAHDAPCLRLQLEDGRSLEVTLGKPAGKDATEINLSAGFPGS